MSYLEELLPEFRKGAKIRRKCWSEGMCIPSEGRFGLNFTEYDARADDWELYHGSEPDLQYIIDHKCLCWFWDDCQNRGTFGILVNVNYDDENLCSPYKESWGDVWENCRPVRKDEVTFYEDKNDDQA